MRFYDFMTLFWAVLLGAPAGYVTYKLGDSNPGAAWTLGALAATGTVVMVFCWRMFKDPGE